MIQIYDADQRGKVDEGWLRSFHTFSFSSFFDPSRMGFRVLRVINEDYIAPSDGFDTHPHENMEIVTYVLSGTLEHKDSMGNGSLIKPGDVQYMSAGTGVAHSEFNPSKDETVHLLQIWILPDKKGHKPRYNQKSFSDEAKTNQLCMIVSGDGANGSIAIQQNARIYSSKLAKNKTIHLESAPDRHFWLQMITGEVTLNGKIAANGDGLAVSKENALSLVGQAESSEFLLFDLP